MTPTFLPQIVSFTIYCPPFDKVWLRSVCWSPSAKPDNEVECRIYRGWLKSLVQFKLSVYQSSRHLKTTYETHCSFQRTCPIMYIVFRSEIYRPLNLPRNCEIVEKTLFLCPRFLGGGYTSNCGHAFSNRTYFRACGRNWLSSVQRARRVGDEEIKKERIAVKPKSADNLCRAA